MKKLVALLMTLSTLMALAQDVVISRMQKEIGYSHRYILKTDFPQNVVLDCQSFIQGLLLGPVGEEHVILLDEWECQELVTDTKNSLRRQKKHCLNVDLDRSVLYNLGSCRKAE